MQRLVYLIIYPFLWITSILPMGLLYIKSDVLSFIIYHVVGYRKKVVLSNLRLVFPDKSDKEHKIIARKFYRHLCNIIFESIKTLTISEKEITKRFRFENLELIDELYKKDKSVLLLCGHYSSWEWSGILGKQMKYKGLAVYKKLRNDSLDGLLKKIRGRYGGEIVSNRKIVPILFRLAKENTKCLTLILADQTPKPGAFKHRDTFMGIDVPVFTGSEEIAKKLDFASVYLKVEKVKRGYYSARFVLLAENPKEFEDYQITRAFLDEIEKQIHKAPEYYLWSHKRWKLRN
ncbi:MAG: lysophospholipid acyltransferase family protein [Bacteroidia bacterium]|nr:lysophospholipid acyltransferase family protein [Bacteroidia bacterium]NNF30519.1 lysophospholipid acyltransferase family protein [Flavobacteriaceae bacterium]MBT8274755.1 lysophospholipid acyltransferase family protein [Bacteroidia bacterium]NNJ81011.1 lysophospholipid acyltransferase family protein [Flavobacteriaceae bacterium]NNK53833.1 lysophospholipid acyltransferase family protein [Flavobacteriaceae bacterium]